MVAGILAGRPACFDAIGKHAAVVVDEGLGHDGTRAAGARRRGGVCRQRHPAVQPGKGAVGVALAAGWRGEQDRVRHPVELVQCHVDERARRRAHALEVYGRVGRVRRDDPRTGAVEGNANVASDSDAAASVPEAVHLADGVVVGAADVVPTVVGAAARADDGEVKDRVEQLEQQVAVGPLRDAQFPLLVLLLEGVPDPARAEIAR
eukprot:scaffold12244_cov216-Isochrysis_galbana.AAC.10